MSSPIADPGLAPPLSLHDLPNELLHAITLFLVPQPPATTRFALRQCGTWEFKAADAQWAEWNTGHRDLQAFTSTSRRLRAVAGPHLYDTVVIHSGAALVRLYRHLLERPHVRQHIRALSCLINPVDTDTINDARREWRRLVRNGFDASPDFLHYHPLFSPPRLVPTHNPDSSIAIGIISWVIGCCDMLADLLFASPDRHVTGLGTAFAEYIFRYPSMREGSLGHKLTDRSSEPPFFPAKPILDRLTSLRLYCNREGQSRNRSFTQTFSSYVVSALPRLEKLHTLELCCDSPRVWASILDPNHNLPDYPSLPAIHHVRLYGSRIREPELVALCAACPNLETLMVHFEDKCDDDVDRPRLPDGKTLNDALLGLADSLQSLELVAMSDGHYLTRGRERPRKPENHRLRCFPHLHQLRHLTVDYRGLFGTLGTFAYEDGEALRGLLPASLRSFTLVCEWGTDKDFKQSYLADLDMMLDGVKLLCVSPGHRLSRISLAIHSWPERRRYRGKFRRHIHAARVACNRAGVAFRTFEPCAQYRDEDEAEEARAAWVDGADDVDGADGADGAVDAPNHDPDHDHDEGEEQHHHDNLVQGGDDNYDDYDEDEEDDYEEEEQEDDEYYFSDEVDDADFEREARRPPSFEDFLHQLGDVHGHDVDELYNAYVEDRWDEYLF